jgi:tetratricopeptide (TPR) repeat protein
MKTNPLYNFACIAFAAVLLLGAARQYTILRSLDRSRAYTVIGDGLASKGLPAQAGAAYERGCSEAHPFPYSCLNLGDLLIIRAQEGSGSTRLLIQNALEVLKKTTAMLPTEPTARLYLGIALAASGRYSDGEAEMRTAVKLAPDNVAIRRHLVDLLKRIGNDEAARRETQILEKLKNAANKAGVK